MRSLSARVRIASIVLAVALPGTLRAEPPPAGAEGMLGDFGIGLRFGYLYGEANGFLQTPSGGNPGTSSSHRPKLDEIGADEFSAFDGALDLSFREHHVDLGGQWIGLDGSGTLDRTLVSRGVTFPAGTRVQSDVTLEWYRLGYRYRFDIPLGERQHLFLAPGVQGALLDYDYQLSGGGRSVARSFPQAGARLGGTAEWRPHPIFAIEATAWWGLPIDETAEITDLSLVGRVRAFQIERGPSAWFHIGIGYEHIEFEDDQDQPNHIDVGTGVLLNVGIELRL